MNTLTEIWNFIENNPVITIIGLLGSILTIVGFFKKPKIVKEIIREATKVIHKTKKVIFPTAEDWFQYGEKAEKQNKIDKAIRCYKKAIELKPDFYKALYNIGHIFLLKVFNYEEAIKYFKEVIKLRQNDNEAPIGIDYLWLGMSYLYNEDKVNAVIFFDKTIDFFRKDINKMQKEIRNLQQNEDENNKKQNIIELNLKKIKIAKSLLSGVYCQKGILYASNKNFSEALICFQEAVRYNENNAEAYYHIGRIHHFIIPNLNKSEEYLQKAIKLNQNYAEAHFEVGLLYFETSAHYDNNMRNSDVDEKTIETYKKSIKSIQDYDKAIIHFTKSIELKQNYAQAYFYRGCAFHDKEDYIKAISNFEKAILYGYNANKMLGRAYYRKANNNEDYDKALEYFNEYIKLKRDKLNNDETIYYWIGETYFAKGKYQSGVHYDSAIVYFLKAIDVKKDYADAYYCIGLVFLVKSLSNSKDSAIGIKYIQRAEELGSSTAKEFLNDSENKELISNATKIEIGEKEYIYHYWL